MSLNILKAYCCKVSLNLNDWNKLLNIVVNLTLFNLNLVKNYFKRFIVEKFTHCDLHQIL